MAVTLVNSSTSGTTDTQSPSKAVPVPTGAAAGMVAVLTYELWQSTAVNPTVTWPAGFVECVNYVSTTDGFQKLKAAYKVLTGADAGSYTASWTNHWNQGQCTLWSGVDTSNVLDVAVSLAQNSTGTALPGNALSTASPGCGMLHVVANENTSTGVAPTGYAEQREANYLRTNTKIAGAAGSETISGGSTSASTLKLAALIALRPAAAGGGVTGTASALLPAVTGVATGQRTVQGSATAALSAPTAAVTGVRTVLGTAVATLAALTATAVGARDVSGNASAALPSVIASAVGVRAVTGTASAVLPGIAATATGSGSSSPTATAVLPGLVATAVGHRTVFGAAMSPLGALSATVVGRRTVFGLASAVLPPVVATVIQVGEYEAPQEGAAIVRPLYAIAVVRPVTATAVVRSPTATASVRSPDETG